MVVSATMASTTNITIRKKNLRMKNTARKVPDTLCLEPNPENEENKNVLINVSTENSFSSLNDEELIHNLKDENINLKNILRDEKRKNSMLQTKLNLLRSNKSGRISGNTHIDFDSMDILTPLKQKIKNKEDENFQLHDRIMELENENKNLCQILNQVNSEKVASCSQKQPSTKLIEIKAMQRQIKKLNSRIKTMQDKLLKATEENITLNKELKKLRTNDDFLKKINECSGLLSEVIHKLRQYDTSINSSNPPDDNLNLRKENNDYKTEVNSRPKLLLLSDYHGTELLYPLSKIRKGDYNFTADIQFMGSSERVLQDIEIKVQDFTKKDCVIIMCGVSDFNVKPIRSILDMIETCILKIKHTNVILCNIPYSISLDSALYNEYVTKFNSGLSKRFSTYEHIYLRTDDLQFNQNDYNYDGYKLRRSGKFKLASSLNQKLKLVNEKFYNGNAFL